MKITRFFLLILLSSTILTFVTFLNVKLFFMSYDRAQVMLEESNIYPVVAAGIRENLLKNPELPASASGPFMEVANEAITEATIKNFVEDFTKQYYFVINNPGSPRKVTLHFGDLQKNIKDNLSKQKELNGIKIPDLLKDRDVNLSKDPFTLSLININKILIGLAIAMLVLVLLLLLSGSWAQKLIWLGATFFVAGLGFLFETLAYYYLLTDQAISNLAKLSKMRDEKFLLGISKLINYIADYQKIYYTTATIILIVSAIVFIVIGKAIHKEKFDLETPSTPPAPAKPLK